MEYAVQMNASPSKGHSIPSKPFAASYGIRFDLFPVLLTNIAI
jgi:hypothetical protein